MTTREEQKLFTELAKRGTHVAPDLSKEVDDVQGPRNPDPFDPKTTSVSPSSPKPMVHTNDVPDSGPSMGRGNPHSPGIGDNIPPKIVGLELPTPMQLGGSNTPQSSIRQLPSVTLQQPGQVVPVSPPKSQEAEPDDLSFRIVVPRIGDPYVVAKGTSPSSANPYGPHGRISPRTAGGADANPPSPGDAGVVAQIKDPVGQERVGDKPNASDSTGVVKLSDDFVNAGTRRLQRKGGPSAAWFEKEGA